MNVRNESSIKMCFEENGKNYLIYRLEHCDKGLALSLEFWKKVQAEFTTIDNFLKNYTTDEFKTEDWDDFKKIKEAYSAYVARYQEAVINKLDSIINEFSLEKYKDLNNDLKGLKILIKNETVSLWGKVQYGSGIKDTLVSSHSTVISKLARLDKAILQRLALYSKFQTLYEKSVVLLSKVYINDLKEQDYEIVFSFENNVDPDLSIFLYQEVYRLLKEEVVPSFEKDMIQLTEECCAVFSYLKEAPVHKFLCRLDHLFVKINTLSSNQILFHNYSSVSLNSFIERFKVVEKLFSSKLVYSKKISEQFYSDKLLDIPSQSDFTLLVMWELLSINCSELLVLKSNPDWDEKINSICADLYSRLQKESVESIMSKSAVKIIPWQTLAAINLKYAEKFLDVWKEQFLKKQYPSLTNSNGLLLTGKNYLDDDGEYEEAVCIYLYGIQNQSYVVDKRSSLEKNCMVLQQKGLAMSTNSSIKIGVQLSLIIDRCILSSKHKQRFAM